MIPITKVEVPDEDIEQVVAVLRSGLLAQGSVVERFEALCRRMTGARHAIAVNSGTTALVVALEALDLEPGDEVVTSPFTFAATLNAILEAGAVARFADVATDDFGIDPSLLDGAVSDRTKVLMPVHLYGQSADMDPIVAVADRVGASIVEDAAQAHAATYHGRPVGTWGLAAFSFYATKNLQSGEGGVVTTDDDLLAERMRILRNQGMRARYEYVVPGHNYRLTDLAAAVAVPQFDRLARLVEARRANAAAYQEQLSGIEGLVLPVQLPGRGHVWHQFTVQITGGARRSRDEVLEELAVRGIGAGVYYPRAVYDYPCYRDHPSVRIDAGCPTAEELGRTVLSLPVHQHLTPSDVDQVAAAVRDVLA